MPFNTIHIGDLLVFGSIAVATLAYLLDRKKDNNERRKEREVQIRETARLHEENKNRLETLAKFHEDQIKINQMRDVQIGELSQQTALMQQTLNVSERRLQLIEDRCFRLRDKESGRG